MLINFSNEPIKLNKKSIFLAGPTYRNRTFDESWRKIACEKLQELGFDGLVYVPEYSTGNMKPDLTDQASWERAGLQAASIIIFYIPRKLPELAGFTTNIEFGMWITKKPNNCMLCIPDFAEKVEYVKWLWSVEIPNKPIYVNLDDVLGQAIKLLNKRQQKHKKYKVIFERPNLEPIIFDSLKQACMWINTYTHNNKYPWSKHRYWKLTQKLRK